MSRAAVLLGLVLLAGAAEGDWPGKRGPQDDWTAPAPAGFPGSGIREVWRRGLGVGSSGVAVAGGALVSLGNADNQDSVWCLNAATGAERWRVRYPAKPEPRGYEGGPNATPTIVDGRVYTISRQGLLLCLAVADGREVWRRDLVADERIRQPNYGFACSPLVRDGLVVLNVGTHGRAYDAATGALRWESGGRADGYASAVPALVGGVSAVLTQTRAAVSAARLADGQLLWNCPWPVKHAVADPLPLGDRIFATHAYGSGSILIGLADGGRIAGFPTSCFLGLLYPPVRVGDHLYGSSGDKNVGDLRCLALDGTVRWSDPTLDAGNCIAVGGTIVMLTRHGVLAAIAADPQHFRLLWRAQVLSGTCWTIPAYAGGRLIVRDADGNLASLEPVQGQ